MSKMNCGHQNIVDIFATHESNAGRVQYIGTILKECGSRSKSAPRQTKEKVKRRMSGYNCYVKECAKKKSFKDCITDPNGWSTFNQETKDNWNYEAKEGCK